VNDLLRQYKKEERSLSGEQEQQKFTPISQVIDSILTEKRTQFRSKIGVNIESSAGDGAYGLFTRASEKELKRVISNLINNSVEAFEDHGQIRVEYGAKGNEIVITIDDNGKGIPKDLLAKLGQRGETYGKVDGLGLGLYHAKTCIDSWGGEFTIQSEVGLGTRVSIKIPKSKEPSWFLPAISLKEISTLVILDDDVSIHQIWEKRLKELNLLQGQGLTLEQFSRPQELVSWYKSDSNPGKLLFLIDQQFLANEMSGLNVIEQLEIQSKSILVTSHFDEQEIISKCERLGVKIIPKGLASVVPILSEPTH
jgi:anti-sigma regulatory factor (Ser/Thr protein kinase)